MLQMRQSLFFMLIITLVGSFFAYKITSRAYSAFDYELYDTANVVPVVPPKHK